MQNLLDTLWWDEIQKISFGISNLIFNAKILKVEFNENGGRYFNLKNYKWLKK